MFANHYHSIISFESPCIVKWTYYFISNKPCIWINKLRYQLLLRGHRGRDRLVVRFNTTYASSAYQHLCYQFESRSREVSSIQHYVIVCRWPSTDRWFTPGTAVISTNKTDRHNIIEILLKEALKTITPNNYYERFIFLLNDTEFIRRVKIPKW